MESITFNTAESKLVVAYEDGTSKEYIDAESYLADWPDRMADAIAMGWIGGSDNSGWSDN